MLEMTRANHVLLPDRLMSNFAIVSRDTLSLDYDGNKFWKDAEGRYHTQVQNIEKGETQCDGQRDVRKSIMLV